MRGDRERKKRSRAGLKHGGNRWCRLHVECLEGRLLLSGTSLLSTLESVPTVLLSSVSDLAALGQSSQSASDNQAAAQGGSNQNSGTQSSGNQSSGTLAGSTQNQGGLSVGSGLGLSLNLAGLATVQIGNASSASPANSAAPANPGAASAGVHASNPALLDLSLGGDLSLASDLLGGGLETTSGVDIDADADGGLAAAQVGNSQMASGQIVPGQIVASASLTLQRAVASPKANVGQQGIWADGLIGVDIGDSDADSLGQPPGGQGFVSGRGPMGSDFHADVFMAATQIAQTLSQSAAKDARQSDDPHGDDAAIAAVTVRNADLDNAMLQNAGPAAVVNTTQIPPNPTSASTIVTDEAAQQLPLVARAAAAIIPAAMRVATDAMIAQSSDPETPASAVTDDSELAIESSASAVPVTANLVPTGLLAIVPGDLRAVDQALERLLDEIDAIGGDMVDYAASSDLLQWATAGVGLAACVGGAYFHRKRRPGTGQSLEEESASWMFTRMQGLAAGGD